MKITRHIFTLQIWMPAKDVIFSEPIVPLIIAYQCAPVLSIQILELCKLFICLRTHLRNMDLNNEYTVSSKD